MAHKKTDEVKWDEINGVNTLEMTKLFIELNIPTQNNFFFLAIVAWVQE